jgi:hypothetical protein
MQNPTDQTKASIPTETPVNNNDNGSNKNRAVKEHRKAAKRTLPWDLQAGELDLVSPTQAEEIRAMKRPRLEQEPDVSVRPPPPPTADSDANANANADLVSTDTQPNAGASIRATPRLWTLEEDTKLTSAVTNTSKKKCGKEYNFNWAAIATLVPSRTSTQCRSRWNAALDPSIDRTSGRKGSWTADEDIKLKDAVEKHDGKDWANIAALVPGRTKKQCNKRWRDGLDPNIDQASERAGKWTADEISKLKDEVLTHGGKDWGKIAALVPGRTKSQCHSKWYGVLKPSIDQANERAGKWTADEDSKLKDAAQKHGGKSWNAIAALIPGRTKTQCSSRWHTALNPSIAPTAGSTGKWTPDEDSKLKDAVQTHGGKNWVAISATVPGRTKLQCNNRWQILQRSPK